MRILVTQETDWIERNAIVHHRLLESLSLQGHEVTVVDYDILWRSRGFWPLWQPLTRIKRHRKVLPGAGVDVVRPGMLRIPTLGRASWLVGNISAISELCRPRPDVVIAYGISNALLSWLMARRYRVPFIYHLLEVLHSHAEPKFLKPLARWTEQMVMRHADRVLVVNKRLGQYATSLGVRPDRVEVIPIGAVPREPSPEERRKVRASLGIRDDELVLLYLGYLYETSGMREFTRRFVERREQLHNLRLLVVGDGPLLKELNELCGRHQLQDRMVLTGRRPAAEVPGYIAASDIGIWPALRDGNMEYLVPTKVLEYMEHGRPVLASRFPGLETEFGQLPGLLFMDTCDQGIDRALELAKQRHTLGVLGESCTEAIRRREDWETVVQRFERSVCSLARSWTREGRP